MEWRNGSVTPAIMTRRRGCATFGPPAGSDLQPMRLRSLLILSLALAAIAAVPSPASAGARMETSIMDDQLLLNASAAELETDMALFKRLGVDRLRVSAFWNQVSPTPDARTKPAGFDLRDHTSGLYNFAELDRVVNSA